MAASSLIACWCRRRFGGLARVLIPVAEGWRPFACPFRCRMAHPTPEEERATIHGPGFALTIAQQRVVGRAVSLVPVMAKLISCKSRFRDRCYRGRLAVSVRVCGSPDRLEGGRGHAGNVSCFIVERLFERFCTGNRMQSNAKCLSATEMRLNRAWCRDSNFPLCSWIRGAIIFTMRAMASQSARRGRLQPPGGPSMFFFFFFLLF
jgi:hypothetical protein